MDTKNSITINMIVRNYSKSYGSFLFSNLSFENIDN